MSIIDFERSTLDNALTIISETNPSAHTASAGFFVRTGARDEDEKEMGVSHFLEHMMFKGTDRRTADDVNREFDEIGAAYNAYTSNELTCFYATVLPEHLPKAIDLLSDMLRPALREEDFTTEKGVILEEIAMYKDNPFWVLYEEASQRHYGAHGLGYRVLGTTESIKDLTREEMMRYFRRRYSADNTTIALSGALDFEACVKQIGEACSSWENTGATRDNTRPEVSADRFEMRDPRVSRGYLIEIAEAPSIQDERRYAAMMLAKALGDPDNSRLHWALLETGLADEAQAGYSPHDGTGDFMVYAACAPDRLEKVEKVIAAEIDALVDGMSERDLERQRNRIATAATREGERPSGRMQRIGAQWAYTGEHRSLEEELERINAVTLKDVRAVHEAFPFRPRTVGAMLPERG